MRQEELDLLLRARNNNISNARHRAEYILKHLNVEPQDKLISQYSQEIIDSLVKVLEQNRELDEQLYLLFDLKRGVSNILT